MGLCPLNDFFPIKWISHAHKLSLRIDIFQQLFKNSVLTSQILLWPLFSSLRAEVHSCCCLLAVLCPCFGASVINCTTDQESWKNKHFPWMTSSPGFRHCMSILTTFFTEENPLLRPVKPAGTNIVNVNKAYCHDHYTWLLCYLTKYVASYTSWI